MSQRGFEHQPFEFGMSTTGSPTWEYVKDLSHLSDSKTISKSYGKNVQYYLKKINNLALNYVNYHVKIYQNLNY